MTMSTSLSEGIVSRRLRRLAMVAALPLLALACSNDSPPAGGGTGGTTAGTGGTSGGTGGSSAGTGGASGGTGGTSGGTGGAAAGTGGASGTGGTTAGTGGTSGVDGGIDGGVVACAAATAASPLISDFAGTTPVSNQANGGTDLWSISPAATATIMVAGGEMHAQSTGGNYASTATVIGGLAAKCVDVSKYTGVKFKIRSPTNTSLLFLVPTPETNVDFSSFRKQITVTPTATTVMVPFTDLVKAPFGAGMMLPASYLPAAHMAAIGFGVGTATELMNIYLDDVSFY